MKSSAVCLRRADNCARALILLADKAGLLTPASGARRASTHPASVETRASWVVAWTALAIYTVSFGAPVITVVALKPIAAELGGGGPGPARACSLAWFGAALGGIPMGWMAERFGIRRVVMFGATM